MLAVVRRLAQAMGPTPRHLWSLAQAMGPSPRLSRSLGLILMVGLVWPATVMADPEPVPAPRGLSLKAADHLRHRGETKQAAPLYRELRASPELPAGDRAKAAYFLGFCEESEGRFEAAFEAYKWTHERFPKSDSAELAAVRIDVLAPHAKEGFQRLHAHRIARAALEDEDYQAGLKALEPLQLPLDDPAAARPDDRDLYYLLGEHLRELGQYRRSARAFAVAARLGIPEAEELSKRSLRYITRARLTVSAAMVLIILGIMTLAARPWQTLERRDGGLIGAFTGLWIVATLGLIVLSRVNETQRDDFIPIGIAEITTTMAALLPAVWLGLIWTRASRPPRPAPAAAAFTLIAFVSALFLLCAARDWYMLIGL